MGNVEITLGVKSILTPTLPEQLGFEATHVYQIDYTDVNTGGGSTDTETVKLMDTPAEWAITHSLAYVATAFAGTGAFAMEVGTNSTANNFLASTSVMTAGPIVSAIGCAPQTLAGSFGTASDVLEALFTNSSSGSPSALSAGRVFIFLRLIDLTGYKAIAGANKE